MDKAEEALNSRRNRITALTLDEDEAILGLPFQISLSVDNETQIADTEYSWIGCVSHTFNLLTKRYFV